MLGLLQVKLNELVKPNKAVADYRTEITGVSAEDLEGVACSLTYIQVINAAGLSETCN